MTVEFDIRVNKAARLAYFPKTLFNSFRNLDKSTSDNAAIILKLRPGRVAAILYPAGAERLEIIESVQRLLQDLESEPQVSPA